MTTFVIAFASLALILGVYAFVALPFGGRARRILVSGFFALLIAGLFFGYSDMLGRPKSTRLELLRSNDQEAKIIGSYMIEGSGIYLWLLLPGARAWRRRRHAASLRALLGKARPGFPSAAAAEAAGKRRPAAAGDDLFRAGAGRLAPKTVLPPRHQGHQGSGGHQLQSSSWVVNPFLSRQRDDPSGR
jgi:hypothetical protein